MRNIEITPETLRDFFFKILELEYNQTPSHRTDLPMKTNQSLNFMIDSSENISLVEELVVFSSSFPFLAVSPITFEKIEFLRNIFGENFYPVTFKLIIKDFENLRHSHSSEYTFIHFNDSNGNNFNLPIEKVSDTYTDGEEN